MKSKMFRIDNKSSHTHIIGYMMNSLKNSDIELSDNKLVSILYDIKLASKIGNLFLIGADDDLTLLMGFLDNRIFTLVFYENKWTEYFVYNHNFYSIMKFGNVNNPYLTYETSLDYYNSIINNGRPLKYNKFKTLVVRFNKMFECDPERFTEIIDRSGNVQLLDVYNILVDYEIIKKKKEEK